MTDKIKVLMLGWEFPPFSTGGLGTACYGLSKGLSKNNIKIDFVVPFMPKKVDSEFVNLMSAANAKNINITKVNSILTPYMNFNTYDKALLQFSRNNTMRQLYGKNLFEEVYRYSKKVAAIARFLEFDIIHAHDWMTFLAGIEAKNVSKKPLVIHVHATEFDRTGDSGVNQIVYDIEKQGMQQADRIVAVSNFTKNKIMIHYGIDPNKISVVHNAVELDHNRTYHEKFHIKQKDKIVLFLGRLTLQKGPDYFIYAAKKVLEYEPNVKFIIAGSGDMESFIINKSAELGIGDKVLFAGFLKGDDIDRMYQIADVYVMPSVSEPFGITPLEAMRNNTPVIISKQSGVSEVIKHCLKVDFWDIDELADKMISVLRDEQLHNTLKHHGSMEVQKFSWNEPAQKCIEIYKKVIGET